MPLARAALESLLQARKLGVTLTSACPPDWHQEPAVVSTDIAGLDARLGGGFPRGQVSAIAGPRSTGRTGLLCAVLAAATARGELVALVDTLDCFDPGSGARAGIDLSRLLWIRGMRAPDCSGHAALARTVDRAIKALSLVVRAGGFGVVALDLADVPARVMGGLPYTTWMRVSHAIEGSSTACVLLGSEPIARSPGGVTVILSPARPGADRWVGQSERARLLSGLESAARVSMSRLGRSLVGTGPDEVAMAFSASPP